VIVSIVITAVPYLLHETSFRRLAETTHQATTEALLGKYQYRQMNRVQQQDESGCAG
jgi:hypothetical protein